MQRHKDQSPPNKRSSPYKQETEKKCNSCTCSGACLGALLDFLITHRKAEILIQRLPSIYHLNFPQFLQGGFVGTHNCFQHQNILKAVLQDLLSETPPPPKDAISSPHSIIFNLWLSSGSEL